MNKIPAPSVPTGDQNRFLFCQMAIEGRVQDVVEEAIKAGWNEGEVLAAMIEIADNLMLASQADADVTEFLDWVRRRNR